MKAFLQKSLGKERRRAPAAIERLRGAEVTSLSGKYFGTFKGVYLPTLLNIMGLMMYLRQGWVVGNAGLLGAISIVVFSCALTGITALCISSIITNIRIGSGGVFSLVSQSLGLQVGGSIGIPLYMVQALSAVMYMFGFLEAWAFIFPTHPRGLVIAVLAVIMVMIAFVGVNVVFRLQVLIMLIVFCALASIFAGAFKFDVLAPSEVIWWGRFEDASYWKLFAIYFPAVTGIKVGASMSGSLYHPRKSIPKGTLLAWGTSSFIYIMLCIWYAFMGGEEALRSDFLFSVHKALSSELVLLGIMLSCFTAAVSSMIAAPRVLQAVSSYDILPYSKHLKKLRKGEPLYAFMVTIILIVFIMVSFDNINSIAPLVTQFFIVIYFIINSVLVLEQRLNLVSFRPELRLPKWIPLLGSVLSLVAMVIISPILGLISLFAVALLYFYLSTKQLQNPWETVQSGLLVALSEWLMRWAIRSGSRANRRIWKPDFLIPLSNVTELKSWYRLLEAILYPQGSLNIIFLHARKPQYLEKTPKKVPEAKRQTSPTGVEASAPKVRPLLPGEVFTPSLKKLGVSAPMQTYSALVKDSLQSFHDKGLYAAASTLETRAYLTGLASVVALAENFFPPPNSVFVSVHKHTTTELNAIINFTYKAHKALVLWASPFTSYTGREEEIVIWVRDQTPHWQLSLSMSNLDYAILLGYQLKKNWKGKLRLICAVAHRSHIAGAQQYLTQLKEFARLGTEVNIHVVAEKFSSALQQFTSADIHIIGIGDRVTKQRLMQLSRLARSTCLFVRDSGVGLESALV